MTLTKNQIQRLANIFPFLVPRNVWSGKIISNYNYDYYVGDDVGAGWERLFLLYCKHLKTHLVKENYIDKFFFTDVKEKYGTLRLYNLGIPSSAHELEIIFQELSREICWGCGKRTAYESLGYTLYLCADCKKSHPYKCIRKGRVKFAKWVVLSNKKREKRKVSLIPYLDEYYKCSKMTDDEFITYLETEVNTDAAEKHR